MKSKKSRTREQVATAKQRAANFVSNVLEDDARAGEIEAESLESYAERKRIVMVNPSGRGRLPAKDKTMPTGPTKLEFESMLDQIADLAADALDPTTTRKEAIEAIQAIYDIAGPDDEDEDDEVEEDEDDEE